MINAVSYTHKKCRYTFSSHTGQHMQIHTQLRHMQWETCLSLGMRTILAKEHRYMISRLIHAQLCIYATHTELSILVTSRAAVDTSQGMLIHTWLAMQVKECMCSALDTCNKGKHTLSSWYVQAYHGRHPQYKPAPCRHTASSWYMQPAYILIHAGKHRALDTAMQAYTDT